MDASLIAEWGIVGCGGAGFPTHVKMSATGIEHLIVNAAECEPLLHKDKEILHYHIEDFMRGLIDAIHITGAKYCHIGIKKKYTELIAHIEKNIPFPNITVLKLGDFYPSGDEYELVYEATKRLIPNGGIPLHVGCVVSNVETILNIGRKRPVVTKFLTIAGEVPTPITVEVPIGVSIRETLALSGLKTADGFTIIDGGPMMGRVVKSVDEVISKTCSGLIVLPNSHPLVRKITRNEQTIKRIARSACDQCTDCTELCPRHLLGYPIAPHKAMRTAQLSTFESSDYAVDAIFCCECGLCSLYACPEDLPPREITVLAKKFHLSRGRRMTDWKKQPTVHPLRAVRRVSISNLMKKLGLLKYDRPAPLTRIEMQPNRVVLPLKMAIGVSCEPIVRENDRVVIGQKIAIIPSGKLGAVLHASISGIVKRVDSYAITIERFD